MADRVPLDVERAHKREVKVHLARIAVLEKRVRALEADAAAIRSIWSLSRHVPSPPRSSDPVSTSLVSAPRVAPRRVRSTEVLGDDVFTA